MSEDAAERNIGGSDVAGGVDCTFTAHKAGTPIELASFAYALLCNGDGHHRRLTVGAAYGHRGY